MTKVIKQAWIICLILLPWAGKTQETIITGKITDVTTGAPIPFANVFFINTNIGATTDFEGYYRIVADHPDDSLTASYIGYKTKSRSVIPGQSQTIHFQLEEDVYNLEEVVFYAGENPAFPILRKVIEHKNKNDKRRLDAFEYESYTKTQISIDNITEDFKHTGLMMKISHILDSIEVIAGEDGEAILPIFISEAISKMYYKRPQLRHEKIIKTKISGVGITDGTLTSQVIGSSFQEYNFYQNWLNIVEKEFISPIADGWRAYYDYFLVDSLYIGDHYCYRLEVSPKQSQDLAFTGTLWVTKNEYALKQIDVTVNRSANLNFIEKIKLQQELEPTEEGPWIPVKTRVLIDVAKLTNNMASVIANFYVSNKNIKVNNAYKDAFYMLPIKMDPEVRNYDPDFWRNNRHDSLTGTEINVYKMIDTLKTITEIKLMTDLSKFLATGYHKIGKIEIGPYSTFFADNDVEGIRIGLGARTSIDFSNKVILGGGVGYGFDDQRWKYSGYFGFIVDRDPWTKLTLNHQLEVDPVWVLNDDVGTRSLFYAYSRFSIMVDPYLHTESGLRFERQIGTGLVQRLNVKHQDFKPLYDFQYFLEPGSTDSPTKTDFKTTEINFETRFG